ncbi:MAG: AMP-binding protein [Actinobacteria bacterium]|nr:AMP-binding protein [Actinomycetota bacterium]
MVFRSPYPDVTIPDVSLPAFVLERAADLGDKPALVDGPTGRSITFAQLAGLANRCAAGFAARGLSPGEVVGLFAPNVPEYAVAFHGVALAGGASTTVNSLFSTEDVRQQLENASARFLVTVAPFLDRAMPAAKAAGVQEVFVLGEADEGTPFISLLSGDAGLPDVAIDPANDVVALPYSSGTTGFAKGVQLTHRNLVANVIQSQAAVSFSEDDVMIGVLPFFHIYGLTVILNLALWRGATVVTMPRFELEPFLSLIEEHRVTVACIVPPIVLALAKHPEVERHDLSKLGWVLSGAAPLDEALARAAGARIGALVVQGYGLTEASPVVSAPSRDPAEARPGTIGRILPSTEIRVVDVETGADLGPDEDGEILVRGPQVMTGYLNGPEATALTLDRDGWLHTGDVGHAGADGYLSVVDRLKELIKYRGYQVPPAELEALLLSHPAVADCAVIPARDEVAGEVPKAFVVRTPGAQVTEGELMSWVSGRVPSFKKVRRVEFIEEIPRSASGKILRRVLVERGREREREGAAEG